MGRTRIAAVGEVAAGSACVVDVGGRRVALFNVDGTHWVLDDACPHRGGPLSEGGLDGAVVTCPWHGWRWDVQSGASVNNPSLRVGCFPVTIEGGDVFIDL